MARAAAGRPGESTCVDAYGKTACGFSCLAAHGVLACARTASGTCAASATGVVCWDPPEPVRAHYRDRTPRPGCLTRAGTTVCGYRCVAHDDDVQCASSPDGICVATALGVTCWDPAPTTYCADQSSLPRPQCVQLDDRVTCGYACEARSGKMGCAATPAGRCEPRRGEIVCWDPEPPPMCGAVPCSPEPPERTWCPPPSKE